MANTTIIQALQNTYTHWVSFNQCSIAYYNNQDEEPYLFGENNIEIDQIPAGASVTQFRFKLSKLVMYIQYEDRYYVFQENPFDETQAPNTMDDFLNDDTLHYSFGTYTTNFQAGTMAHETGT